MYIYNVGQNLLVPTLTATTGQVEESGLLPGDM